jgi:hypothetical protein
MREKSLKKLCFIFIAVIFLAAYGSGFPADEKGSTPFRLVTQDNLWFSGPPSYGNYKLNGKSMIPIMPLLGYTNSWDVRVKKQELQWLLRYTSRNGSGLIVSQEWIQPKDGIDSFIQTVFLPILEKLGDKALWNVFYDPVLAAMQRKLIQTPPIDFENPAIRKMWEGDLEHLRKLYFGHRQYWKIQGKPVLYIWNVPALTGADAAFAKARNQGVYLLGDVQNSQARNPSYLDGLPPLDCATGFLVVIDVLASAETTIGEWIPYFADLYQAWNEETAKRGISFIPAGSCQYDDTEFALLIAKPPTRVLAKNRTEVETYLATSLTAAQPVGGTRYVFWGTSNNWAEGTTILPTRMDPPDRRFYIQKKLDGVPVRRIGNYAFEHLNAVKKVMFPKEKAYSGPLIKAGKPLLTETTSSRKSYKVKVTLSDCDIMGSLSLFPSSSLTVTNPPDIKTLKNLIELKGFVYVWNGQVRVDILKSQGKKQTLKIKFANRDGRAVWNTIEF